MYKPKGRASKCIHIGLYLYGFVGGSGQRAIQLCVSAMRHIPPLYKGVLCLPGYTRINTILKGVCNMQSKCKEYLKRFKKDGLQCRIYNNNKCDKCKNICFFSNKKEKISTIYLPDADRIIINLLNNELEIGTIFKIIDDITEYFNGELGLISKDDFLILYDDNHAPVDRYSNYF